jgi:hypothetical protein
MKLNQNKKGSPYEKYHITKVVEKMNSDTLNKKKISV